MIYTNKIPSAFLFSKKANLIPEQQIRETVTIYKDALPYILCEIASTIRHEAAHRDDEKQRLDNKSQGKEVLDFDQFSSESRAEPIAERAEKNCPPPKIISGETIQVNLFNLFNQAKTSAGINNQYLQDVKPGTLDPSAQGMYLMQDLPVDVIQNPNNLNSYKGFDGTIWVDIRKIVQPFVVDKRNISMPSTFQDDGTNFDVPGVSKGQSSTNESTTVSVPSVPSVPSIGAR
jgi:hypothetical protein